MAGTRAISETERTQLVGGDSAASSACEQAPPGRGRAGGLPGMPARAAGLPGMPAQEAPPVPAGEAPRVRMLLPVQDDDACLDAPHATHAITPNKDDTTFRISESRHHLLDPGKPSSRSAISAEEMEQVKRRYAFMFDDEIRDLHRLFHQWDSDHDGEITIQDMSLMIKLLREVQIQELFEKLDGDASGLLDRQEVFRLINMLSGDELSQEGLDAAMNEMDDDNSGQVAPEEFSEWWKTKEQGEDDNTKQELADLFSEVDEDQSGKVDWGEFVTMICSKMEIEGREEDNTVPEGFSLAVRSAETMARMAIESVRADARAIYGSAKIPKGMLERAREMEAATSVRVCFYNVDGKRCRDIFRKCWDIMQVVLLAYVAVAVPYRVGFFIDVPFGTFWWWFEVVVDCYFVGDIFMNFRTSFRNADGELVTDLAEISSNYMRSWFFIDLAACIPITYIGMIINGAQSNQSTGQSLKVLKILRLLRLAKMLRLARVKRVLKRMDEDMPGLWPTSKLLSLIMIILYMGHIFACGWYAAGSTEQVTQNGKKITGWVQHLLDDRGMISDAMCLAETGQNICDWGAKYLDAAYYAVTTLTTVGYGDRVPRTDVEKMFSILTELAGGILFGILAGTLSTMVMATNVSEKRVQDEMLELREFLTAKRIKKDMRRHVMGQMENFYKKKSPFDEKVVLQRLAPKFRKLILLTMYKPQLVSCPLFTGLDDAIITRLCVILNPYLAAKGDDVVIEGEIGDEMYMVTRGEICLNSETLPKLNGKTWVDGAFFGEIPVLRLGAEGKHNRHIYTARALEESDLTFITSKDIDDVGVRFPSFKLQIVEMASKRAQRFGLKVGKIMRRPDPVVNAVVERLDAVELSVVERLDKLEEDIGTRFTFIEECLKDLMSRPR